MAFPAYNYEAVSNNTIQIMPKPALPTPRLDNETRTKWYTAEQLEEYAREYHKHATATPEWLTFENDEKVMWRKNGDDKWNRGHFRAQPVANGKTCKFPAVVLGGGTSWTEPAATMHVHECRRPTAEELDGY